MAETTTERSSGPRVVTAPVEWTPLRGRLRWQLADRELMVAAQRGASGETPAAFARRHGLQEVRVRCWVARVGRKARSATPVQSVAFAPVRVTSAQPAVSGLEGLSAGAVVRVGRGFDDDLLRRVVAALAEVSC
jgi:hypothetical protein